MLMSAAAIDLERVKFSWPSTPYCWKSSACRSSARTPVPARPGGSGKSTLLGLIGGVLAPDAGSVRARAAAAPLSAAQRDRSAQTRGLRVPDVQPDSLSVRAGERAARLALRTGARGACDSTPREAGRLLAALGLADPALLDRAVTQLSIGQQQRVAAARALLGDPELLVADEPTSALDHDAREASARAHARMRAHGTTLLFVSHDPTLRRCSTANCASTSSIPRHERNPATGAAQPRQSAWHGAAHARGPLP